MKKCSLKRLVHSLNDEFICRHDIQNREIRELQFILNNCELTESGGQSVVEKIQDTFISYLNSKRLSQKDKAMDGYGLILYDNLSLLGPVNNKMDVLSLGQKRYNETQFKHIGMEDGTSYLEQITNQSKPSSEETDIFSKAIKTAISKFNASLPAVKTYRLLLPPIPDFMTYPDFRKLMQTKYPNGQTVTVEDYSSVLGVKEGTILLLNFILEDEQNSFAAVSGYTKKNGIVQCCGSLGSLNGDFIPMKSIEKRQYILEAKKETVSITDSSEKIPASGYNFGDTYNLQIKLT